MSVRLRVRLSLPEIAFDRGKLLFFQLPMDLSTSQHWLALRYKEVSMNSGLIRCEILLLVILSLMPRKKLEGEFGLILFTFSPAGLWCRFFICILLEVVAYERSASEPRWRKSQTNSLNTRGRLQLLIFRSSSTLLEKEIACVFGAYFD
jgi:hypothetical protein